ncbi:MAG: FG-GAP-like repeat-containing protein [Candidatus Binataceae bacterium]
MTIRRVRHASLVAAVVLMVVGAPLLALGDPTTLTISGGSDTVTSPSSTTLNFPITRSGDTTFDAFVQYQTQDGTAVAGVNYTAASGSIVIPANASSTTIPVTILGSSSLQVDKTFQMLLLGGGGAARSFTPSFAAQQTFVAGSGPISVTLADLNGDGLPDLIVANQGDNTVSVLLNTTAPGATTPSFAAQQTFGTGTTPASVTAADINGDGKPDLIVANKGGNNVSVLLNTTAPGATTLSFTAQQTFGTGGTPISVTAADVNGDGQPDLIVAVQRS